MPKKPGKRGATKSARAKAAKSVKAKRSASDASRTTREAAPRSTQLDSESGYFHRTLRENEQVSSDTLLSPGQTHVETTDTEGRPAIVRKRYSAI